MDRPVMNEAKVRACMKKGRSRSQCMKEVYGEGNGKGRGKKKAPPKRFGRY